MALIIFMNLITKTMQTISRPVPDRATLNVQITSHKNLSYYAGLTEYQLDSLRKQVLSEMIGLDVYQMEVILDNLNKGLGFRMRLVQG